MPKTDIDYSNTIIYKITCTNVEIKDVYVGHTTNFVQRKHTHKQNCINSKSNNYKLKLYEVIRANGGWTNWKMEIINFFECKDHYEARKKEQEYFITLNATLNSIEPMPKPKVIREKHKEKETNLFFCNTCNVHCNSSKLLDTHNSTKKHLRKIKQPQMVIDKNPSVRIYNFICEYCHFKCSKNSEYIKHLLTAKHIGNASGNTKKSNTFICKFCSKIYKSRKGLWGHNKICNGIIEHSNIENVVQFPQEDVKSLTSLVMDLMKSNNDLQKQMAELCKNSNTTNNIHTNSHNKTFNLHFFLNEQCKDAMNISDFANSFDLQLSDLESVGDLGYVEGITKLFVDKLNSMDIYKRPIHCSDAKREILYVKDDNKWEREERHNPKLRYAIKTISFRNMKLVALWSDTYPESKDCDSHVNERYMKLIKESTGGSGEIVDNENKIIRRIVKEIIIEK